MTKEYTFFDEETTVKGVLSTKNVIVAGRFEGEVEAEHKILLKSSANIKADIKAGKLMVEEGAIYNGTIKLTGTED